MHGVALCWLTACGNNAEQFAGWMGTISIGGRFDMSFAKADLSKLCDNMTSSIRCMSLPQPLGPHTPLSAAPEVPSVHRQWPKADCLDRRTGTAGTL